MVEAHLRNYHAERAELRSLRAWFDEHVEALRRDVAERGMGIALDEQTHGRASSPQWSDPTGKRGVELADKIRVNGARLHYLAAIVPAVEAVLAAATEEERSLVRLWYWRGLTPAEVAAALHVSRETAYLWRRRVLYAVAERLGWR